jgi:hypothetical protein
VVGLCFVVGSPVVTDRVVTGRVVASPVVAGPVVTEPARTNCVVTSRPAGEPAVRDFGFTEVIGATVEALNFVDDAVVTDGPPETGAVSKLVVREVEVATLVVDTEGLITVFPRTSTVEPGRAPPTSSSVLAPTAT